MENNKLQLFFTRLGRRIQLAFYGRVSTKSDDQKNSAEHQKAFFERDFRDNTIYIYDEEFMYFDIGITRY